MNADALLRQRMTVPNLLTETLRKCSSHVIKGVQLEEHMRDSRGENNNGHDKSGALAYGGIVAPIDNNVTGGPSRTEEDLLAGKSPLHGTRATAAHIAECTSSVSVYTGLSPASRERRGVSSSPDPSCFKSSLPLHAQSSGAWAYKCCECCTPSTSLHTQGMSLLPVLKVSVR